MKGHIMTQKDRILFYLCKGEQSAPGLARLLDTPVPSIRRAIQALRAEGHNISFSNEQGALYKLGA